MNDGHDLTNAVPCANFAHFLPLWNNTVEDIRQPPGEARRDQLQGIIIPFTGGSKILKCQLVASRRSASGCARTFALF